MGLYITATIHQVENAEIDDMDALNADLMNSTSFRDLYGDFQGEPGFTGPFRTGSNGELEIACNGEGSFEGYEQYTVSYSCFDDSVANMIAKHLTDGKLVFFEEIEGNDNIYWVITPGTVATKSTGALTF
jgi:hypothetical protein